MTTVRAHPLHRKWVNPHSDYALDPTKKYPELWSRNFGVAPRCLSRVHRWPEVRRSSGKDDPLARAPGAFMPIDDEHARKQFDVVSEKVCKAYGAGEKGRVHEHASAEGNRVGDRAHLSEGHARLCLGRSQMPVWKYKDDVADLQPGLVDNHFRRSFVTGEGDFPRAFAGSAILDPGVRDEIQNCGNEKGGDKMPGRVFFLRPVSRFRFQCSGFDVGAAYRATTTSAFETHPTRGPCASTCNQSLFSSSTGSSAPSCTVRTFCEPSSGPCFRATSGETIIAVCLERAETNEAPAQPERNTASTAMAKA